MTQEQVDRIVKPDWRDVPCLDWDGRTNNHGYGYVQRRKEDGKRHKVLTHRLTWEECYGPLEPGEKVLHRCDRPPCRQPLHLFKGSQKENIRDAVDKGRLRTPNANAKQCWRGHDFTRVTDRIGKNGRRIRQQECQTCRTIDQRSRRALALREGQHGSKTD